MTFECHQLLYLRLSACSVCTCSGFSVRVVDKKVQKHKEHLHIFRIFEVFVGLYGLAEVFRAGE